MKYVFTVFAAAAVATRGGNATFPPCDNPDAIDYCIKVWNPAHGKPAVPGNETDCFIDEGCCPGTSPTGFVNCTSPTEPPSPPQPSDGASLADYAWFLISQAGVLAAASLARGVAGYKNAAAGTKGKIDAVIGASVVSTASAGLLWGLRGTAALTVKPVVSVMGAALVAGFLTYKKRNPPVPVLNGGPAAEPLLEVKIGGGRVLSCC